MYSSEAQVSHQEGHLVCKNLTPEISKCFLRQETCEVLGLTDDNHGKIGQLDSLCYFIVITQTMITVSKTAISQHKKNIMGRRVTQNRGRIMRRTQSQGNVPIRRQVRCQCGSLAI